MYYSSVNRGLTLTNPGKYTVALTMALGLIAMASGLNAVFLVVSFLMAVMIVSGVMSERVMKHTHLRGFPQVNVNAHAPFQIEISIDSHSKFPGLAGLECFIFRDNPKLSFFSLPNNALGTLEKNCLMPEDTQALSVPVNGVPRGCLSSFPILVSTTFPFGILQKFKLISLPAKVVVYPERNLIFEDKLRQDLGLYRTRIDERESFYSHRSYRNQDSIRLIDWKKSAGRDVPRWVTREFEGGSPTQKYIVDPQWKRMAQIRSKTAYENYLSVIATALAVLSEHHQEVCLALADGTVEPNLEKSLEILASMPAFPKVFQSIEVPRGGSKPPYDAAILNLQDYVEFFS